MPFSRKAPSVLHPKNTQCNCFQSGVTTSLLMGALQAGANVTEANNIDGSWAIANAEGSIIAQMSTQYAQPENFYAAGSKAMSSAWLAIDTSKIQELSNENGPLYSGYMVQGRPIMSTPGGLVVCGERCGRTPNDRLGVGASSNTTDPEGPLPDDFAIANAMKSFLLENSKID